MTFTISQEVYRMECGNTLTDVSKQEWKDLCKLIS